MRKIINSYFQYVKQKHTRTQIIFTAECTELHRGNDGYFRDTSHASSLRVKTDLIHIRVFGSAEEEAYGHMADVEILPQIFNNIAFIGSGQVFRP